MDARTLLRRSAVFNSHRLAVVADTRRLTFEEVWDRGVRLANGLMESGLTPGAPVGVLEENSLEAADLFVGAAVANLVKVPLYARNHRESHIAMLNNAKCELLLVDERHLPQVEGIEEEVPTLRRILVRDATYERWLEKQDNTDPNPPVNPDDYFIIRHTGGTSGAPKPVAITHRKWLATARDWFYPFPPVEPGDPLLHIGPVSHASGYQFLPVWAAGGVQVLASGLPPEGVLDILERERIAYTFLPPSLLNLVCQISDAKSRDYSSLKVVMVGSQPYTEATIREARDLFGDVLYQLYGQTEAVPISAATPGDWFAEVEGSRPLRSAGRVFPWADVEIRDEENQPLPLGLEGEIAVRCEGMMDGFYDQPDETAKRLVDGWVLTGDMGILDENGYLYLVDRKTDMIVSGGFNIYPGELEQVIADHPDVYEVLVFGAPHEKWGETPVAVCAVRDDATVTPDEIINLVSDRLGSYKKPSEVRFQTDPLPRSPVGKLSRLTLRDDYWKGHDRRIAGA